MTLVVSLVILASGYWSLSRSVYKHHALHTVASFERKPDLLYRLFQGAAGSLPGWLVSPHTKQLDWIDSISEAVWPHVGLALAKQGSLSLVEQLLNDPKMAFLRPKWLAGSGIKVLGISSGTIPPKVTGVEVQTPEGGNEVLLDFEWSWSSNAVATLCLKSLDVEQITWVDKVLKVMNRVASVKVQVKDFAARGKLRFCIAPLLDDIPVAGAIKVSLLGVPALTYRIEALGGNPFFLPGLENWLDNFLRKQVMTQFLYPMGYTVQLTDKAALELKPKGLLIVNVLEALNLPRMDWYGRSDPFCKVWLRENRKMRTGIRYRTLNPRFDEQFVFIVHEPTHQLITFQLLDSDWMSADDEMGRIEVPIKALDLTSGAVNDFWIPVPNTAPRYQKKRRRKGEGTDFHTVQAMGHVSETNYWKNIIHGPSDSGKSDDSSKSLENKNNYFSAANLKKKLQDAAVPFESLMKRKEMQLHVAIEYHPFSASDLARAERPQCYDAQMMLTAREDRVQSVLRGGLLLLNIDRAENLAVRRWQGFTRNLKIIARVGKTVRTSQRSRGTFLHNRNPVFEELIEILLDGEEATAPDAVISIELWETHVLRWDTFRGRVTLPLSDVQAARKVTGDWRLEDVPSGRLTMSIEWLSALSQVSFE